MIGALKGFEEVFSFDLGEFAGGEISLEMLFYLVEM